MYFKIKKISESKILRDIAHLASGNLFAQLITVSCVPLIVRLYGSESFGLLSTYMAAIALFLPIMTCSYSFAVNIAQSDSEAKRIVGVSIFIAFLITFFAEILIFFLREAISSYFNFRQSYYLFFIPISLLGFAVLETYQQWIIRKKLFVIFSYAPIFGAILLNALRIIIGYISPSAIILILINLVSGPFQLLAYFILGAKLKKHINAPVTFQIKSSLVICKKYIDFPFFRMPQLIIFAASQNFPVLIIAGAFGMKVAGYYSLAKMATSLPSGFIGKSVGDIFYQRVNESVRHKENVYLLIHKATKYMALVASIPYILIFILAPFFFGMILGAEWVFAGECARWLAIFYYINLIKKPCFVSAPALGMQKELFVNEFLTAAFQILGLVIGIYGFKNLTIGIAIFSIVGASYYLFFIFKIISKSKSLIEG